MKCRKCGGDIAEYGRRVCYECMQLFIEGRTKAFREAEKKFGKLNKENVNAIKSYVKAKED